MNIGMGSFVPSFSIIWLLLLRVLLANTNLIDYFYFVYGGFRYLFTLYWLSCVSPERGVHQGLGFLFLVRRAHVQGARGDAAPNRQPSCMRPMGSTAWVSASPDLAWQLFSATLIGPFANFATGSVSSVSFGLVQATGV